VILAVVGGKGGVGTSTLALELGAALSGVVVDADLGMADLPSGRGPDLHDVLAGRAAPTEAIRRGGDGLRVLPCGRSLADAGAADVGALAEVLRALETDAAQGPDPGPGPGSDGDGDGETLRSRNEVVVIDCPNGMRADAGVPLAVADACVLVAPPRGFALADAVRARELARELDAGLAVVALNRVVDDPPVDTVARLLGAPAVAVPADPRLGRTLPTGRPVTEHAPDSVPADRVDRLADRVRHCRRHGR
jgi:septum site-determining protein MinD